MRIIKTVRRLAFGAVGALAMAAELPSDAAAVPSGKIAATRVAWEQAIPALYRRRQVQRDYQAVQPDYAPPRDYRYYSGSSAPGFYDQGFAFHGNINGCVVDQGYGRYEPCNGRH